MSAMLENRELQRKRKAARRTAIWLAVVAFMVFTAFILSGVLKQ